MLHGIKPLARAAKPDSAVELLVACHDRIRNFTGIVRKLAHAEGTDLHEISSAADAAYRYFSIALPLHEADEEESMRPRLEAESDPAIVASLQAMGHQHQAVDDLLERLLPLLRLLTSNPGKLPECHGELCTLTSALAEVFEGHLRLEEETIFPAVSKNLSQGALDAILIEMKERRKQGQAEPD